MSNLSNLPTGEAQRTHADVKAGHASLPAIALVTDPCLDRARAHDVLVAT